jgi:hypothetical protein
MWQPADDLLTDMTIFLKRIPPISYSPNSYAPHPDLLQLRTSIVSVVVTHVRADSDCLGVDPSSKRRAGSEDTSAWHTYLILAEGSTGGSNSPTVEDILVRSDTTQLYVVL